MRQRIFIKDAGYGFWELVRIASRQGTNVSAMLNMFGRVNGVHFVAVHVDEDHGESSFLVEHDIKVPDEALRQAIRNTLKKVERYRGLPPGSLDFDFYYMPEYEKALEETVKEAGEVFSTTAQIYGLLAFGFLIWKLSKE